MISVATTVALLLVFSICAAYFVTIADTVEWVLQVYLGPLELLVCGSYVWVH